MPIHGLPSSIDPLRPSHFNIEAVIRPNILALHPYRCARDDYQSGILLDANENSLGHSIASTKANGSAAHESPIDAFLSQDLHRYPDPAQLEIKSRIADLRGLPGTDHVFLGVGSDEVIDLLMRICCKPEQESVLLTPPTYGMYAVCAQVNDVKVVKVPLDVEAGKFALRTEEVKKAIASDPSIKLIFLCSPGNPTGTLIDLADVKALLDFPEFKGIVIVDEAYIDFAPEGSSAVSLVKDYANLCVLQTLSKSFGLAAIRLGVAIAQPPLIQVLTNTKAPYNISTPTASLALSALSPSSLLIMRSKISTIQQSRNHLISSLASISSLGLGSPIGSNHANFVMIPILDRACTKPDNERAKAAYIKMAETKGVVVRYRGSELGCEGCLRITIGTDEENKAVVERLAEVLKET
ncbi:histidinol-phosphate aminotransferase [Sistotremastrum niveocremeum HHB9708]|uniref:histidinol-phosphate transaminase n=1 Tax=Sistotremastrum niveocremeum HHB9708 TaxID=1314777 RepID=A0A164YTW8_9AGAM|nr:histidinol-phosphate aminotransferase [Sistotremastrum niveocremeum HHB9708]